jgi:arsenate reductase
MMLKGTVKFFNASKGFGFIAPDEGEKDIFVPASSLSEAGISDLKPGQRISFNAEPQAKGPKAIDLVLLADLQMAAVPKIGPGKPPSERLTLYHDPNSDRSITALAELRITGHAPHIVEYLVSPPNRAELKRLSAVLRTNGQSLIRRYDPLFLELHLDDRFLSEDEFWDAVIEHPSLINGPVVTTTTRAAICCSAEAVHAFLDGITPALPVTPKRKALSDRALRFLRGETVLSVSPEKSAAQNVSQAEPGS